MRRVALHQCLAEHALLGNLHEITFESGVGLLVVFDFFSVVPARRVVLSRSELRTDIAYPVSRATGREAIPNCRFFGGFREGPKMECAGVVTVRHELRRNVSSK